MTTLTEQWKKRELPDGEYWCLSICGDIDKLYCYQNSFWKYKTEDDYYGVPVEIKQVLDKVPSFEQWQEYKDANDSMFDTIKMLNKDNYKLEKENTKLKTENKWYSEQLNEAVKQYDNLKELLKECKEHLITYKRDDLDKGYVVYDGSYLIDKINQVLGE